MDGYGLKPGCEGSLVLLPGENLAAFVNGQIAADTSSGGGGGRGRGGRGRPDMGGGGMRQPGMQWPDMGGGGMRQPDVSGGGRGPWMR